MSPTMTLMNNDKRSSVKNLVKYSCCFVQCWSESVSVSMSALEKGLAAPIIILQRGRNC